MTQRTCKNCGISADASEATCPACGDILPFRWSMIGLNDLALRKIGLTVLIPLVVWKAMTALLGTR
jgi:threonine synthase